MQMSDYRFYTENMYIGPDTARKEYFEKTCLDISEFEKCEKYRMVDVEGKMLAMSEKHYDRYLKGIDTVECAAERLAYALAMPYFSVASFLELGIENFKIEVMKRSFFEKDVNSALRYYCMISPDTFLSCEPFMFHNKELPLCSYLVDQQDEIYRFGDMYYVKKQEGVTFIALKYQFSENNISDSGIYIGTDKKEMYKSILTDAADKYDTVDNRLKIKLAASSMGIEYDGKEFFDEQKEISKNKTII